MAFRSPGPPRESGLNWYIPFAVWALAVGEPSLFTACLSPEVGEAHANTEPGFWLRWGDRGWGRVPLT